MKKFIAFLLFLVAVVAFYLYGGLDLVRNRIYPSDTVLVSEEIIETVEELEEMIAHIRQNFYMSAKINIRSLQVWEELDEFYVNNPEYLVKRGITGMEISYLERSNFIEAEVFPKYEMYMNIIIAHETGDTSHLTSDEKEAYDEAKRLVKKYGSATSIFEKALNYHDHLIDTIEYDYDHENNENAFNVYGALIEGLAVCQGYAHAYKLLLYMSDVETVLITGHAGGENHAWNLVNYGSRSEPEWYHVDVTWNDDSNNDEGSNTHQFFNIPDSIISHTHRWNKAHYPTADSMGFNYFRFKGMVASTPSELETSFKGHYDGEDSVFEILCRFEVTMEDLSFLRDLVEGTPKYSVRGYGDDNLLTIFMK
jgi:hypothetical protein